MKEPEALMRMNGGPQSGTHVVQMQWPLPDEIPDDGGRYVKISQSQITDEQAAKMTHVIRGAEYRWEIAGEVR